MATLLHCSCLDIPFSPSYLAPGKYFRIWVLITYQFFYLSLFRPNERPPPFNFQKSRWDDFDFHCPSAEEYLPLFSAAAIFTSLTLNAAESSIPFGRIKSHPKAWWSAEVEEAVSERRKAFATAYRSDEDRQAYISGSRRTSSVIAKAEAWQMTCSFLSPKSNPKSAYSLLRSVAGTSSTSPDFPNSSSPRESTSVFANSLRSHFSVFQPKALPNRDRGYLFEFRRATCTEESHSYFCFPFFPLEFLAAASNLSLPSAAGPDKVSYSMLKHLPCPGMDFLVNIFYLSWTLHSFLPSGGHLLLSPSTRWESLTTLLLPSGLSLSPPAYQSFLNALYYLVYSSFWNLIPFFLPARPVSTQNGLL